MKKISILFLFFVAVLAVFSCKKTEEETTLPSLSAFSINTATPFVREGTVQTFSLDVSRMVASDGEDIRGALGVAWHVTGATRDTLTRDVMSSNPSYTVKSDVVGNYTVTCYIFSMDDEYYSTSTATSFSVIEPETALTGQESEQIILVGDKAYSVFNAGGLTWMGQNLYGTSSGVDYEGCEVVSDVFGRYYTWEEAVKACPEGWRLPTALEFDSILGTVSGDLMVNAQFLNKDMWSYWPEVKITNARKFNAIPVGYMDMSQDAPMFGYLKYACWWTADQMEDDDEEWGVFRYIYEDEPTIMKGKGSKTSLALTVRCVKESGD